MRVRHCSSAHFSHWPLRSQALHTTSLRVARAKQPPTSALPYALAFLLPTMHLIGGLCGGAASWLAFIVTFGVIPLFELISPDELGNFTPEQADAALQQPGFRALLLCFPVVQVLLMFLSAYRYVYGTPPLRGWHAVGWMLSTAAVASGNGITAAHELFHRVGSPLEHFCGRLLMRMCLYGHFVVEHVHGHHKNVATPLDPATARRGETVYAFCIRSVVGSFLR